MGRSAWRADSSLSAVLVDLWLVFVLNSCLQAFPAGPEAAEASLTPEDHVLSLIGYRITGRGGAVTAEKEIKVKAYGD